jgi:hypothetical protein
MSVIISITVVALCHAFLYSLSYNNGWIRCQQVKHATYYAKGTSAPIASSLLQTTKRICQKYHIDLRVWT